MTKFHSVSLSDLRAQARSHLDALLMGVTNHSASAADFAIARLALESLPLTTAAVAIARNRLDNAWAYLRAGEHGAAGYELGLLARDSALVGNDA
jgi:hypothetical protein